MTDQRRLTAQRVREDAAALAASRSHPEHQANGDEQRFAAANYAMSFTKGLPHDTVTGLLLEESDFDLFVDGDEVALRPASWVLRWVLPTGRVAFRDGAVQRYH